MNKKNSLMIVGLMLGMGVVYVTASQAVPRIMVTMTRAAPEKRIDIQSSYIIGENLLAKANGKDMCKVNIFVLDKNGMGVPGKRVELTGASGARTLNEITDKNGKVTYEVVSTVEGQFKLGANIEGVPMGKGLTVTFRN